MHPGVPRIAKEMSVLGRLLTAKVSDAVIASLDRSAYLLLAELDEAEALSVSVLADSLFLDISTASRQVAALEAKGLVARITDPEDGRACLVRMSDEGRARYREVREARSKLYETMLKSWPDAEIAQLEVLLARLTEDMKEHKRRSL